MSSVDAAVGDGIVGDEPPARVEHELRLGRAGGAVVGKAASTTVSALSPLDLLDDGFLSRTNGRQDS